MANEVQVFEFTGERGGARKVPTRDKQTLSIDGAASASFDQSTTWCTIISTTSCVVEFGTAPDGLGVTFPIVAGIPYDFDVAYPGKVIAVTGTATAPAMSGAVTVTGGATSAKQDTIIGHVDGIETALTAANASLDAIEAVPPMTNAQFLANLRVTPAFTSVNSANTSTQLLAANANRKGLIIVNTDANALYIDISGGSAATTRYTKKLATDEQWECPYAPVTAITGIWAADGAGAALITELA